MSPDVPPHAQLPPVQKLRIQFAKRGRLRFTSHRDFQRAFERALRRARVPMAYSQGFSPHPKVAYAGAASTGAASEAEYLEISVTEMCRPDEIATALDNALPPGLDVVRAVEASGAGLADRLQASEWHVVLPDTDTAAIAAAVEKFLAEETVGVERTTKKGPRTLDVRSAVVRMEVTPGEPALRIVVRHLTPTVRPDDILTGLRRVGGLLNDGAALSTRLTQGPLDKTTATVNDPLAA